jgi:hypothetical protein
MSTGNTNLKRHIRTYHRALWDANAGKNGWKNLDSQVSTKSVASQGRPREEFDVEKFHQRLVHFIVADDQVSLFYAPNCVSFLTALLPQAINVIECPEFRDLLLLLRSDLQDTMIPRRTKVRQMVLEAWNHSFVDLKRDLAVSLIVIFFRLLILPVQNALGLISFTCDIWSDQTRQPFLAITAHWVASVVGTSALKLKSALIAFHQLSGHHTGKLLAMALIGLLDRAGVTSKVITTSYRSVAKLTSFHLKIGHFTLDGASNNDTMLTHLKSLLVGRGIPTRFDPVNNRIYCYAHIIDLGCKAVVGNLPYDASETQDDEEPLTRHPVALASAVVQCI